MKRKKLEIYRLLYLFIVILTIVLVGSPHIFPQPFFMPLRFPHYLEMMPAFLGISWPMTFEIYHYALYTLAIIGSVNVLGILNPKFKQTAIASSSVGLLLMPLMILFFFFVFINVNASTAIIYGLYSAVLLIADWLTFKALIRPKKGALRG